MQYFFLRMSDVPTDWLATTCILQYFPFAGFASVTLNTIIIHAHLPLFADNVFLLNKLNTFRNTKFNLHLQNQSQTPSTMHGYSPLRKMLAFCDSCSRPLVFHVFFLAFVYFDYYNLLCSWAVQDFNLSLLHPRS